MDERQRGSDEKQVKTEKQKVSGNGRRDQVAKKRFDKQSILAMLHTFNFVFSAARHDHFVE